MVSRRLMAKAGIVAGVGTVVSAFGIVTPAQAYTCDSTIAPVKSELVAAIDDGDAVICITEGTMDMGLDLGADNAPIVVNRDLTVVGIGDVIIDGNDEAPAFLLGQSDTDVEIAITIDNLTVTDFHDWDYNEYEWGVSKYVPVVGLSRNTSGSITVLNSEFTSNDSYLPLVAALDQHDEGAGVYGDIVIDNTLFAQNYTQDAIVWGYGQISVSNSTFIDNLANDGVVESWIVDSNPNPSVTFAGNQVSNNAVEGPLLNLDTVTTNVFNNTFVNNESATEYGGILKVVVANSANFAFNTVTDNASPNGADLWAEEGGAELTLLGNIVTSNEEFTITSNPDSTVTDLGGNFSTADDALTLEHPTSAANIDESTLELGELTDNGGPNWTRALGPNSVAQNVVPADDASELFLFSIDTDQRGEARGAMLDAGAVDDGSVDLAETGFDAPGLAVIGGITAAVGVALATRRRTV